MKKTIAYILAMIAAVSLTACDDDKSSDENIEDCTNDEVLCSSTGIPVKCVNGKWETQFACISDQVCKDGVCEPKSSSKCNNDAVQCSASGLPQKCVGGSWVDQTPCGSDKTCKNGLCESKSSSKCNNDAVQCSASGLPQKCVSGEWKDQPACDGDKECKAGVCEPKSSSKCNNDAVQCSASGVPQKCMGGDWVDQPACDGDKVCESGRCVKSCSQSLCADADDKSYVGSLCIDSDDGKTCGCTYSDLRGCKFGYRCTESGVCKKSSCSELDCVQADDEDYVGSLCIEFKKGEEQCGCDYKNNKGCKAGYTCAETGYCVADENRDICVGYNSNYCLDEETIVICDDGELGGIVKCANYREFGLYDGDYCLADYGVCGCEYKTDCKDGYICNDMAMACDPEDWY